MIYFEELKHWKDSMGVWCYKGMGLSICGFSISGKRALAKEWRHWKANKHIGAVLVVRCRFLIFDIMRLNAVQTIIEIKAWRFWFSKTHLAFWKKQFLLIPCACFLSIICKFLILSYTLSKYDTVTVYSILAYSVLQVLWTLRGNNLFISHLELHQ